MELTLTDEEQAFLLEMLEQCHRELLNEIAHTDHRDFKQRLLKCESTLDSLVGRLQKSAVQQTRG